MIAQDLADLSQFFRRSPARAQRLLHELTRRTIKHAIEQVADQATLDLLLRSARSIDVRALALVSIDEPLIHHDLKLLQDRGVPCTRILERLVHGPHRAGSQIPQDLQDLQLSGGRVVARRSSHVNSTCYEFFRNVNEGIRR